MQQNLPKKQLNQLNTYLLRLCGLAFLLLYLILVYNNRLAADDFHVIDNVQKHGVLGSIAYEYEYWSGRWSATLVSHAATVVILRFPWMMPLIQILIAGVFSISIYHFLHKSKISNFTFQSSWDQISFALTAAAILFLATINKGDTWMWWCASFTYLLGTATIITGLALILDEESNRLKNLFSIVCFAYAGGASEPAAATTLILLIVLLGWRSIKPFSAIIPKHNKPRLIYAILSLGISFGICMYAPGNATRSDLFPEISTMESFILNFKMLGVLVFQHLIPGIWILAICVPGLMTYQKQDKSSNKHVKKPIILLIAIAILIFVYQWTITKVTGDVAADRATLFILASMMIASIVVYNWIIERISISFIQTISLLILAGSLFYHVSTQLHTTTKYAEAYDLRIQMLLEANPKRTQPILNPLPPSGFLYSAEISSDITHHSNVHLREGLNLHFTPSVTNSSQ